MKERIYIVEVYEENGKDMVFIATDLSNRTLATGCKYEVNSPEEVGQYLADYIKNYDEE